MQVKFPMKTKEKYIHALQERYCSYANTYDFSSKQFQFPIQRMMDSVEYVIQQYDKDSFELLYKHWWDFQNKQDEFDINDVVLEAFKRVMHYSDRRLDVIAEDLQRYDVNLPEDQESYLNYISEMTNKVVNEVFKQTIADNNNIGLRRDAIFTEARAQAKS